MKKKIAIIGSGIAGLTLASLLKTNSDFDFTVYEKNESLNIDEGFGIQLSANSISILNKIGFDKLNKNEKFFPFKLDFYSINLNKICDLDLTTFNFDKVKYTTLKRSILIKFLKEKLFSNSIIFQKEINKIEEINDEIKIYFIDGSNDVVDFLIVSDGIFSNTKAIIEKKIFKPNYAGSIAVRTQISPNDMSNLDSNNISLIMGSNNHSVLYPINQKKEINLVSIIRNKLVSNNSIKSIVEKKILKENKNLNTLFNKNLKSWPVYTSLIPTKSIYKNVLYIGDAFYTFTPTMAQGASQAIEAANEIFQLIATGHPDIQNEYFKNRLERINLINKRSKFNYYGFHISNPILKIFRNKILKSLVNNKRFINSYLGKIYK